MTLETPLDDILDARSKVRVARLFALRTDDFLASGREVARLTALSPPAAHAALRSLLDARVLGREIVGRQHLYRLNSGTRLVRDILRPLFTNESGVREDIASFLERRLAQAGLRGSVVSVVLYGSLAAGRTRESSDCDVAVVAREPLRERPGVPSAGRCAPPARERPPVRYPRLPFVPRTARARVWQPGRAADLRHAESPILEQPITKR